MTTVGKRLKALIEQRGLLQKDVALDLRADPALISNIINGRRKIPEWLRQKLVTYEPLGLSPAQLEAWELEDAHSSEAIRIAAAELEPIGPPKMFVPFPCRGYVSAGQLEAIPESQDVEYFQWMDPKLYGADMFCLKIKGDSMEPKYANGGVLLVREVREFKNDRIYVVQTDGNQSTFKVLRVSPQGTTLIPLNPSYAPIDVRDQAIVKILEVLEYKESYA
jgi:SOS-response transcriptional repressor LexA